MRHREINARDLPHAECAEITQRAETKTLAKTGLYSMKFTKVIQSADK
jgi:hypothetical protein